MAWNDEEIGDHGTTADGGQTRPHSPASQPASQPFSDY